MAQGLVQSGEGGGHTRRGSRWRIMAQDATAVDQTMHCRRSDIPPIEERGSTRRKVLRRAAGRTRARVACEPRLNRSEPREAREGKSANRTNEGSGAQRDEHRLCTSSVGCGREGRRKQQIRHDTNWIGGLGSCPIRRQGLRAKAPGYVALFFERSSPSDAAFTKAISGKPRSHYLTARAGSANPPRL